MTKSRSLLPKRRFWTDADVEQLRALYPDNKAEEVARALGRNLRAVYAMAKKLGLSKSEAFKASDLSGRIQRGHQDPRMIRSRFQKGLVPWNKGTHYVAGGRSAETRFKKGRKPEEARNYVPIGSYRFSKDGYLERKVTDDPSLWPARRWAAVHRLVWEEAHGKVPKGHMVAFKPGMRTAVLEEITLDRLECISLAENMRRNSIHTRLPPDVRKLAQLKGQITRQVNRIVREGTKE